jgi:predicted nuclease of predicted toxin-antitoxin system
VKVLVDEDLPTQLKPHFADHEVDHVVDVGLAGTLNGELFARISGVYDVVVTADKNQRFQQNLARHDIAVILLRPKRKVLADLVALMPAVLAANPSAPKHTVTIIEPGREPYIPK